MKDLNFTVKSSRKKVSFAKKGGGALMKTLEKAVHSKRQYALEPDLMPLALDSRPFSFF